MVPLTASMYNEHYPSSEEVKAILLKEFAKSVEFVKASEVAIKETGNVISSNVFMLGVALGKDLLPIKKEFVLEALKEKKFFEGNKKMLEMGMQTK
jgi:Pyruvate/2-oxoacid:ferredoxin oxidoreductase gamma subunit